MLALAFNVMPLPEGFEILGFLAGKAASGLVPVFTTLESVFGLTLIIFFDHYRDSAVTGPLRGIWKDVIDNLLGIRQSGGRIETMAREFVRERVLTVLMQLIFGWLKGFPSNNIVNYDDLLAFFKLARCARAAAPQRPKRSPTVRADQPRHLARLTATRGGKAVDDHIRHVIFMPTA